jgi:biotin carboxyl carrier protein
VSQSSVDSLLDVLRRTGFAHGLVHVDGVRLEFGQAPTAPPAGAVQRVPEMGPGTETVVLAGGPGTVELVVGRGDPVEVGADLGQVRVHRKTVPLVAPVRGHVTAVHVPTGAFAAYGDAVCSIGSD